jgi:hypothetical protein
MKLVQTSLIFMQKFKKISNFYAYGIEQSSSVHSLTPKCSLVQTYPLNSWEILMVIIHFTISHLWLKSNNLIMSFFLKKFTNHCIATFLFSTNASFASLVLSLVLEFGFLFQVLHAFLDQLVITTFCAS